MGKQSYESWKAVALGNPLLEGVRVRYILLSEDMQFFAHGQPVGELGLLHVKYGEEDKFI